MVEWREAVLQRLAGPPSCPLLAAQLRFYSQCSPLPHPSSRRSTRRPRLGQERLQGTLTLWFHENVGKDGKRSNKVFGVTNCHVLRKDTTVDYEHRGGAAMSYVRVCRNRRFDQGLDEITDEIANRAMAADLLAREIADLRAKEQTTDTVRAIEIKQWSLDRETEAINNLSAFHADTVLNWSQKNLYRNIGYTQFAPAITVDVEGGTRFTSDWGSSLSLRERSRTHSKATSSIWVRFDFFVSYSPHTTTLFFIGTKYTPWQPNKMFYPIGGGPTTFKFPEEGKFRIEGWFTLDEPAVPEDIDSGHQRFVVVGKDNNTTDLTVGRYAGLVSFTENEVGTTSMEIGIYNAGRKTAEVFSEKGDSGALVWHMENGKGYIVGQLHSAENKGGSTSNHVTYCTPGETLRANIRAKFPHADFFRTGW